MESFKANLNTEFYGYQMELWSYGVLKRDSNKLCIFSDYPICVQQVEFYCFQMKNYSIDIAVRVVNQTPLQRSTTPTLQSTDLLIPPSVEFKPQTNLE